MKTFQEFINESVVADANRASDHALRLSMVAARSDGRADHHAAAKAHVAAAKANKLASEHADTAANMRSHFATNAFEHKVTGRNHTSSKMSASNESVTSFNDFLAEASSGSANYFSKAFGFAKTSAHKSETGHIVTGVINKKEDREALMKHLRATGHEDHALHQYGEHGDEVGSSLRHPSTGVRVDVYHSAPRKGVITGASVGHVVIHSGK